MTKKAISHRVWINTHQEVAVKQRFLVRSGADLGRAVAVARGRVGVTQTELAEDTAIERTYLSRLEAGKSVQLLDRQLRLLRQLGAEVVVLLPPRPENSAGPEAAGAGDA